MPRSAEIPFSWMLCRRKAFLNVFRANSFGQLRSVSSLEASVKPFYITTPVFYPNAAPHIGHLYSLVTADILARFRRLSEPQRPVDFVTGTDEHGMKIQQAAKAAGLEPKPFCDQLSQHFRALADQANISKTRFIRTSEPAHYEAAQDLWLRLCEKGLIYKGKHSGWYSVSDECFYTEMQITEVVPSNDPHSSYYISTETGSRVQWMQEENYMFKLSVFHQRLLDHFEHNPTFIHPPSRHQEVIEYLKSNPIQDLSISRLSSRLSWGIPVPNDPEHTIYVWFEALISYLTAVGYPWPKSETGSSAAWPPDLQVIGKDIVRFHALYFPAMLMALDLPLPKQLLAHSHWTVAKKKMSKSVGNVVDPIEAMDVYGPDVVRFYLARAGGKFKYDIDWSQYQLTKHAKEIMSTLGNFYSRCTAANMMRRLDSSTIPSVYVVHQHLVEGTDLAGKEILVELSGLRDRVQKHLHDLDIADALDEIMKILAMANKIYTDLAPWRGDIDPSIRGQIYTVSLEALRICGILLQPFMPMKSAELLDALGVPPGERTWDYAGIARGEVGNVKGGVILFVDPERRVFIKKS